MILTWCCSSCIGPHQAGSSSYQGRPWGHGALAIVLSIQVVRYCCPLLVQCCIYTLATARSILSSLVKE